MAAQLCNGAPQTCQHTIPPAADLPKHCQHPSRLQWLASIAVSTGPRICQYCSGLQWLHQNSACLRCPQETLAPVLSVKVYGLIYTAHHLSIIIYPIIRTLAVKTCMLSLKPHPTECSKFDWEWECQRHALPTQNHAAQQEGYAGRVLCRHGQCLPVAIAHGKGAPVPQHPAYAAEVPDPETAQQTDWYKHSRRHARDAARFTGSLRLVHCRFTPEHVCTGCRLSWTHRVIPLMTIGGQSWCLKPN